MIAQHVLVFTLVIAFPIWDYFITRRMRDATSVEYRTQVYAQTLAWQWISSAVAVAVLGLPALFAILGTAFLAILFGVMFLGTGNLALPMALHALLDLRVLAIPTRTRDA